jgi:hypothetical protein
MPSKDIHGWYRSESGYWYNGLWPGICHVEATCNWCHIQFYVRRFKSKGKFGTFCSRRCAKSCSVRHEDVSHLKPFRFKKGQVPYNYKGTTEHSGGYLCEFEDGHRQLQHRLVVERFIGRKLKRSEVIHHIDGDKTNNSIENLQIMTQSDHIKAHQAQERKAK